MLVRALGVSLSEREAGAAGVVATNPGGSEESFRLSLGGRDPPSWVSGTEGVVGTNPGGSDGSARPSLA